MESCYGTRVRCRSHRNQVPPESPGTTVSTSPTCCRLPSLSMTVSLKVPVATPSRMLFPVVLTLSGCSSPLVVCHPVFQAGSEIAVKMACRRAAVHKNCEEVAADAVARRLCCRHVRGSVQRPSECTEQPHGGANMSLLAVASTSAVLISRLTTSCW